MSRNVLFLLLNPALADAASLISARWLRRLKAYDVLVQPYPESGKNAVLQQLGRQAAELGYTRMVVAYGGYAPVSKVFEEQEALGGAWYSTEVSMLFGCPVQPQASRSLPPDKVVAHYLNSRFESVRRLSLKISPTHVVRPEQKLGMDALLLMLHPDKTSPSVALAPQQPGVVEFFETLDILAP